MLDVIYYVACSLDGRIATPDGGIEWLAPFEGSGEDYGYRAFYDSIDSVVLGSRTYEQALTFGRWPYPGKQTWVLSQRRLSAVSRDVTVTPDGPSEVVAHIGSLALSRTWLVGGGALAGSFEAAGLITEYIVAIMPVVLGGGVPLFGSGGGRHGLRLTDTTRYPDGVLQARYVRE